MTELSAIPEPGIRRRVLRLSIATAAALAFLKGAVGWLSGSLVILALMVDSLLDIMMSSLNYLSLRASEKPADADHPYGHGKIEYLAGLLQSFFIAVSAGYLAYEGVRRVLTGEPVRLIGWGVATMLVSTAATVWLIRRIRRVIRQSASIILETEALHYTTDVWSNLGAAATVALVGWTGKPIFDPLVGFAVAVYIFYNAAGIFVRSVRELMDHRLPEDVEERLKARIARHDGSIAGFHEFRTRRSGSRTFVEFHLVFRGNPPFKSVHQTTENLIANLKRILPEAEFTIHMDPEEGP